MSVDPNDPRLRASAEAYRQRDLDKSEALLLELLSDHPDDVRLMQNLGSIAAQRGDYEGSIIHLETARAVEPSNVRILNMLGKMHTKLGRRREAQKYYEQALSVDPDRAETHNLLGKALVDRGDVIAAREHYGKAITLKPDFANALVNFASLCEREHKFDEGVGYAERALAAQPSHASASLTLAQLELRKGETDQGLKRLEQLAVAAKNNKTVVALAHYLIANTKNNSGEYDAAFAAYEAANDTFYEVYERPISAMPSVLKPEALQRLHSYFSSADISTWTKPVALEEPTPVFLLGFPRSGTTLLDQILKTHSAITTLEERENLVDARNELLGSSDALTHFGAMTTEQINHYRNTYWARVRDELKEDNPAGMIIDKMPLNTILLGLIHRLFPGAKIIFALRDPRDVVLSCYQQRFGINTAMFQFLKLESAASYYDQVMSLAEVCRSKLPLDVHTVRYEDVVNDMQSTVTDLLGFLGLQWEDEILNYQKESRDRWISTPSAEQVVQPLYASSMGKWRDYCHHMEAVLPTLEPWVRKYGYEPS